MIPPTSPRISPTRRLLQDAAAGRERLFGSDFGLLFRAVSDAMPPSGAPAINVEVPLAGRPGSDVHVRCSRRHFHGVGAPEAGPFWEEHPSLLAWAEAELAEGEGVGVSYDLRSWAGEGLPDPAVYYRGLSVDGFFEGLGATHAARVHHDAVRRLPRGWRCWYTGLFPNREGCPVRLGIVLTRSAQDAYVGHPEALEADFAKVGIRGVGPELVSFLAGQAAQPYLFDVELDAHPDGSIGWPVGVNLTLGLAGQEAKAALGSGSLAEVLQLAEQRGLADDRWRLVGDAAVRRLAPVRRGGPPGLVCAEMHLVYLKLRFVGSEPLDAKAYYQTEWAEL